MTGPVLTVGLHGPVIIADKNYYGHDFEAALADGRISLLRPARKGEPERPGTRFFKPLRQVIESLSTTPSKASSTSSATAATPQPASWSQSCSASSP